MSNLLSVKDISYNNVFKNLTFNISDKSFNILAGKNSIGKTTLLYSIVGLLNCSGEINFKGKRNDIGFISDFSEITKDTAFNYLKELLINLGYTDEKAKKTIYSVSKKMGIDNMLDVNTNDLSNEERLLVLLAHSVIHNPKLVIIDNTLDELSETNKTRFINYLINMKTTVILVTNDSRYFKYANKILVMNKTKMVIIKESKSINRLEKILVKNNSELPFALELSNKLYSYGVVKKLYNSNSELVNNIWK